MFEQTPEEELQSLKDLVQFYEKEQYKIANDNTIQEVIKDLEKHQTEITVDDYNPYDENTWGMMHEEMYVPLQLAKEYLQEAHLLSEHRKSQLAKAKEMIQTLLYHMGYYDGRDWTGRDQFFETKAAAEKLIKEI